jgi:hypothetical protein
MAVGGVALGIAAGCSSNVPRQIEIGQTRQEVITAAGKPDAIAEFTIPDEPFFGPQEGLASLLDAGTIVEEWRYNSEGEVTYVWFATKSSIPRKQWTVVNTATMPADAVY